MLAPLAYKAAQLLPGAEVMFEVPCTAGIPDVVLLDLDHGAVAARAGKAPLMGSVDVRILLALQVRSGQPLSTPELADAAMVSAAHLRRGVLPRLVDGGHLEAVGDRWQATYTWRSLARKIVTVEAKLRDWRRGLAQASRHTAVADEAWLVLDAHTSQAARSHSDWFEAYDVGLASLSVAGDLTALRSPRVNRARQPDRELLVERAVSLHLQGCVSGPVPRVFGEVLLASTGDDPRLRGAAAGSTRPAAGSPRH
ncbi:BadM/Rrf2 family transcriptional regulator [Kineococcus radiotolerans]|nr:BadM/Rrf2 family transcriptional regulator [Kineococcus radiotolerans]